MKNIFSKNLKKTLLNRKCFSNKNIAFIALGSNLGKRFENFLRCSKLIEEKAFGKILKTSQIYESPCMNENYEIMEKENKFINAVIKFETSLKPLDLLKACKEIEFHFKRKPKTNYYEQREIDIDILTYNNDSIDLKDTESNLTLNIPHPRLYERLFVLKPLLDIDINLKIIDSRTQKLISVKTILNNLINQKYFREVVNFIPDNVNFYDKLSMMNKVFFLNSSRQTEKYFDVSKKTLLMATINCTPDSFSIGWMKEINHLDKIIEYLVKNIEKIDIVDIGGESTRPGAMCIEPLEELNRIYPLIEKIKANETLKDVPISIDTRKSLVAKEVVKLGVDIINDVSACRYDPEMIDVISDNNLPYICMHSRATPDKMLNKEFLSYSHDVMKEVNKELEDSINEIKIKRDKKSNILDWNVIVDPGLGFSKNTEHNFELIRNLNEMKQNFSNIILIGHSKKKFIREILNVDVNKTLPGDIVVANTAISKGANIIRVHDVENIGLAVKISDKIYK